MKKQLLTFAVAATALFTQCSEKNTEQVKDDKAVPPAAFNIHFEAYSPKELDSNATPEQLVEFAWNEFLALNWKSSYDQNQLRDNPDTGWSYSDTAAYPDLVVWETYGHRTELRPYSDKMLPFDAAPHYSFGVQPAPVNSGDSFSLFDNLDENNEIGSCNVYAHVDKYQRQYQVLYQAKVNREEYEYIYNNYNTKAKLLKATTATFNNIVKDSAYYPGATSSCDCPTGILCLPCGGAANPKGGTRTGAMEVKTAWRELTPSDDPSKFFKRKVIVYTQNGGKVQYTNKVYALIGLHIIHKTQNYPSFVFATWEHVDVEKDNMGYVLLDGKGQPTGKLYADYPRLHPIPSVVDQSTSYVHDLLKQKNKNSIWQNYRLVGVQGKPTNDSTSFSFFLANYVIESDSTLADFAGSGIGTPHNHLPNTLYGGKFLTVGGCQGCHGVAQQKLGGDFSFLMDTIGKPVKTPDIGIVATPKLLRYVKALEKSDIQAKSLKTARK